MQGLSRFVLRHKWLVVGFWLLVLVAGVPNLQRATKALSQQFSVPGREGFETNVALFHLYDIDPASARSSPSSSFPPARRSTPRGPQPSSVPRSGRRPRPCPGSRAVSYASTGSRAFVSADGRTTFALVYIPFKANRGFTGATKETDAIRAALAEGARRPARPSTSPATTRSTTPRAAARDRAS